MNRAYTAIGLALFFTIFIACDDDGITEAEDEPVTQQEEPDQADEPKEDDETAEAEAPRVNETETPDDDAIGQLPDGIGVAAGESAPDVVTENADGEAVHILELVEDEAIALFFYRGGWCPYCNFQIREMTEAFEDFDDRGVLPVAISVDRPEKASETDATYEIPFPVLADPDLVVHEAFDVVYEADQEEVERLAGFGMDLGEASGRDHNSFAIPGVFIIDADGVVQWAHANPDYSIRPSPQQLLDVIDGLLE